MSKPVAQWNANVGELQPKPGFDIWPLWLPSLFNEGLQRMTVSKKRLQELSRDAKRSLFPPISPPPPPPCHSASEKNDIVSN